jgi:methyl-accepting chemotaxis protein
MFLIYLLILLFSILIIYQLILALSKSTNLIEGLDNSDSSGESGQDYKPYNLNDPNNALILSQQNAGNIEVLKGRIDTLDGLKEKVDNNIQNINSLQTQMEGLVQQQADFAQQIAGSTPPTVTGTDS